MTALLLAGCSHYTVYPVKDNPTFTIEGGTLYALPRTQLCISLTIERRDLSNAPYSPYATEVIGASARDVDTAFNIVDMSLKTANVADPDQFFYVVIKKGSLHVDNRHLLLAIGMDSPATTTDDDAIGGTPMLTQTSMPSNNMEYNLYDHADTFYTRRDRHDQPTMVSTRKDIRNMRQRAVAAAQRLDELKERQLELLNGDNEDNYDAHTIQFLSNKLQEQIDIIIAQFCGTTKRETITFYVTPTYKRNTDFSDTLVWFSPSAGLLNGDGKIPADASPIVCNVTNENDMWRAQRFVRYHTNSKIAVQDGKAHKTFRYRMPEQATVNITAPSMVLRQRVTISQYGPIMELPRRNVRARFDPTTLDLREYHHE
jgi:hypothetical protein